MASGLTWADDRYMSPKTQDLASVKVNKLNKIILSVVCTRSDHVNILGHTICASTKNLQ